MKKKVLSGYAIIVCFSVLCTSFCYAEDDKNTWDDIEKDFKKFDKDVARDTKDVENAFEKFTKGTVAIGASISEIAALVQAITDTVNQIQNKDVPALKKSTDPAEKVTIIADIIKNIASKDFDPIVGLISELSLTVKIFNDKVAKDMKDVAHIINSGAGSLSNVADSIAIIAEDIATMQKKKKG